MRWLLKQTNLLDEPADVLVCSANVSLNLSGGVGAELLGRYGNKMQRALHEILANRNPHTAMRGEVIAYEGNDLPYRSVLHAVSVDGWYQTTPKLLGEIAEKALEMAAGYGARKVAFTVLATGFGNLSFAEFAEGIRPVIYQEFPPIEEVVLGLLNDFEIAEIRKYLPEEVLS